MIPRMSLYKIKNQRGDDSRYPAISHKKRFVPNVNVLDFVREFFGGIQTLSNTEQILKMEQFLILLLCERFGLWSLQCWNDILREKNWTTFMHIVFDCLIGSGSGANSGSMIVKWKSHTKTLGLFSHSKGPGAGRSSQNPTAQGSQVPSSQARFPSRVCKGSQEEVSRRKVPSKRFAGKVPKQGSGGSQKFPRRGSQARIAKVPFPKIHTKVPKSGFPSNLPQQGSQRFPSKASKVARNRIPKNSKGSRAQVPQDFQMFSGTDSQARFPRFPGRGSDARFPSKVLRNRFPGFPKVRKNRFRSKVPKSRFPSQVPKFPRTGYYQEQVCKDSQRFPRTGAQAGVPRAGSQARLPRKVSKDRCPRTGTQEQVSRDRFPSEFTKKEFRSKSQEQICKQGVQCPRKVLVVPDRWSIEGLSRFISSSFQTSFRQTSVDFFT